MYIGIGQICFKSNLDLTKVSHTFGFSYMFFLFFLLIKTGEIVELKLSVYTSLFLAQTKRMKVWHQHTGNYFLLQFEHVILSGVFVWWLFLSHIVTSVVSAAGNAP